MNADAQEAYDEALRRIEACQRKGKNGTNLDLSELGLNSLPPEISQLTALTMLNLFSNQLCTLPPEIGQLTSLTELNLSINQLSNLPAEIGQLSALTELDLSNNQLSNLPAEIGRLSVLRKLNVEDNELFTLPPEIGQLSAITRLRLGSNKLRSLPPEIGQLTGLTALYLFNNQLRSLPNKIGQLSALTGLFISSNQLSALPPEIGQLSKLTTLFLFGNQLSTLPPEISQLSALKHIFLHGNPLLALPPSVLGPDAPECKDYGGTLDPARPADILDYYFKIRGKEGRALREVKVIFVGRGEVGKSSMVDALQGKKFVKNRARTDGISISSLPVKLPDGKAELSLWDFGGQEIMHGTHQFFMTHRSLYVVMVDGRHDRGQQDAEYWLRLARVFGGDSPMLVVMNRQKNHAFDLDRQIIATKHGVSLDHFFPTDCASPQTIKPLKEAILKEAARMLAAEERFPASWWDVKTRLAAMREKGEDYFSEDCYEEICKEHGVEDEKEQKKLLRRLADLGTVVSFPEEMNLSELSVLNPEWATEGIYRVVTNEPLREVKHGLLTRRKLRELLPKERWPKTLHVNYVLDLVEKFDLCFPVDGNADQVLVPELLPDKTPPLGDWEPEKCLVFRYQYPVLPHGVLPRFITRTHTLSAGRDQWRTGVVVADDGAEARLQADYELHTITIWLRGQHIDARRALLRVIRSHFESIHAHIKALSPEEMVAVPGHPEVLVSYRDAILDERRGKLDIPVTIDGRRIDQPLSDLLNGVETKLKRKAASLIADLLAPDDRLNVNINMNDDHRIQIVGNVTNSQVGQTLTNCTNMIQQQAQGERKDLLEELDKQVRQLISQLPEEKKAEAIPKIEKNLKMLVQEATSDTPDREWYEVSSKGLLDATKYVKDFAGNIAGTLGSLGKLLLGVG